MQGPMETVDGAEEGLVAGGGRGEREEVGGFVNERPGTASALYMVCIAVS